jgi:four helix bundle protein
MDVAVMAVELADQLEDAGSPVFANQLHRSAISVPSNIAEGHGRRTRRDYAQFIRVANGSLRELLTQLELVRRCRKRFSDSAAEVLPKADEVARMLNALYTSLQRPPKS